MRAGDRITTVQQLDALPVGSVVIEDDSSYSSASVKTALGDWVWASAIDPLGYDVAKPHQILDVFLTVLYVPEYSLAHAATDRAA